VIEDWVRVVGVVGIDEELKCE